MRKFVFQFAACIAALMAAEYLLPGVWAPDYRITILAGACLGIVYLLLRPLARLLLGIVNLITLGLAGLLLDAALVYGLAWLFPSGFVVQNFLWALAAAAMVDVARYIAGKAAKRK